MKLRLFLAGLAAVIFLNGTLIPGVLTHARTQPGNAPAPANVSAFDLILAMNTLRVSNGLPALIEHPIINAVAQSTAEIMAANEMSGHIGNVRGRIQAAGYGGGGQVWATENFAVGVGGGMGIDQIMLAWADPDHMRPATNPAYCHVGAGVATSSSGRTYYILQAAYVSGQACGQYVPPDGGGDPGSGSGTGSIPVPQIIIPVKVATPDREGKIYHEVRSGQSFWAIAIAYQTTIADLEFWNNLSRENTLKVGQRLFIPSVGTDGYATPTPVGLVVKSPADRDGKIVHSVEPYHTLITISQAYKVPVDRIVALNGIQVDWPLQIGQKLVIDPGSVTPSPTPRPLTPLERVTPDNDGNYYHSVSSGETLSGIASFYEISLGILMELNGLNTASIIRPGDQLILPVTPPTPTASVTPQPTVVASPTPGSPTPSPTMRPQAAGSSALSAEIQEEERSNPPWILGLGVSALGIILLLGIILRKKI